MGIWEAIASTADGVRRRLPDLSAASAIFRRSASWIDRTARVDAPRRISAAVSDPDSQNRIARTTWNLLDHALEYGTRPFTGGIPAYRILKEGLFSGERQTGTGREMSDMKRRVEKLEELEAARGAEGAAPEGGRGGEGTSGDLRRDRRIRSKM